MEGVERVSVSGSRYLSEVRAQRKTSKIKRIIYVHEGRGEME